MADYDEVLGAVTRLASDLLERSAVKLPPERELAERLETSRTTIRRALGTLEEAGIVRRVRGRAGGAYLSGCVVRTPDPVGVLAPASGRKLERSLDQVLGLPWMLRSQGFMPTTKVLQLTLEPASVEVAEGLQLEPESPVVSLLRLRYADGEAISLDHAYLDGKRFAGMLDCDMTLSMYDTLSERFACDVTCADEWLEAVVAPAHVAGLLDIAEGDALIRLTRLAYDERGHPVEHSFDLFRSDRCRFKVSPGGATGPAITPR
ncbi:GntR family transcriptional regulator [Nocardioides bruguierae]|uniref:GntR family transcriptional regulator n=1 Tax=Nocardioides bruguierae TaxID=2945102 RepID=UPI0020220A81|nr:GntR family transcriptional regulator [Nocardioides bruguierae]MCL8025331.1 GntR family transcriptional regulator [Nocardioides bruguierae]